MSYIHIYIFIHVHSPERCFLYLTVYIVSKYLYGTLLFSSSSSLSLSFSLVVSRNTEVVYRRDIDGTYFLLVQIGVTIPCQVWQMESYRTLMTRSNGNRGSPPHEEVDFLK